MALIELSTGRKVLPEKSFRKLIKEDDLCIFFRKEIRIRGWKNVLYRKSDAWHTTVVDIFYERLEQDNHGVWSFKYLGGRYIFYYNSISKALDIAIKTQPILQNPIHDIETITPLFTIEGRVRRAAGCIDFKSLRKNQALVAYWLGSNVLGTTKPTDVNRQMAHIIWQLQEKNRNLCLVRLLYNSIISAKEKGVKAILPVLITCMWNRVWKIPEPDGEYIQLKRQPRTQAMKTGVIQRCWHEGDMAEALRERQRQGVQADGQNPLDLSRLDGINDQNALARVLMTAMAHVHNSSVERFQAVNTRLDNLDMDLTDLKDHVMGPQPMPEVEESEGPTSSDDEESEEDEE